MVIPLINRIQLCFWLMLETIIPDFFPDKRERNDLRQALAELQEELNKAQEELLRRGQALRCMDQLHATDRELWRRQYDLMAGEIKDLMTKVEMTEVQAMTDPLTGVSNRRGLENRFLHICKLLVRSRSDTQLALMAIDIDHFKQINDRFGHGAGDTVLVVVAALIQKHAAHRSSDIVARNGGDEFFVVLPHTTAQAATELAMRLCQVVSETRFPGVEGQVTLSCGVATTQLSSLPSSQPESIYQELMRRADQALYSAKRNGRNCVMGYREEA